VQNLCTLTIFHIQIAAMFLKGLAISGQKEIRTRNSSNELVIVVKEHS